jgi:uridine kinase
MLRTDLLARLAHILHTIDQPHPLRVAVDGIDAAGKTTLANELTDLLQSMARTVIRSSIDNFHNPRNMRYQRGSDSPQGYYLDAFDYAGLQAALFQPLGPGGNRCYRTANFDFKTDHPVEITEKTAGLKDILLFDGVFLLRPELSSAWDFSIFVDVIFETALQRALRRDSPLFGSPQAVLDRYQKRYLPAQHHYLKTCSPKDRADVVIDNNDPEQPFFRFPSISR